MQDNPYRAPKSEINHPDPDADFSGRLYQPFDIAVATLFGSVLIAGILAQSNFEKLGNKQASILSLLITIPLTIILLFISLFTNGNAFLVYVGINFLIAVLVMPLLNVSQGTALEQHEQAGRPFHSLMRTVILGFACLVGLGIMRTTAVILFSLLGVV